MENVEKLYYKNGNIKKECWYKNDKLHKDNELAIIEYDENGNIESEYWYKNNEWHRDNGPAIIYHYENGNIKSEYWYKNGKYHRDNGPTIIKYSENIVKMEILKVNIGTKMINFTEIMDQLLFNTMKMEI